MPVLLGCSSFTPRLWLLLRGYQNCLIHSLGRHWELPELQPSSDALDFFGAKQVHRGILTVLTGSPGPDASPVLHLKCGTTLAFVGFFIFCLSVLAAGSHSVAQADLKVAILQPQH